MIKIMALVGLYILSSTITNFKGINIAVELNTSKVVVPGIIKIMFT